MNSIAFDVYIYFFLKSGVPLFVSVVPTGIGPIFDLGEEVVRAVLIGHEPAHFGLETKVDPAAFPDSMRNYRLEQGEVIFIPDEALRDKSLERMKRFRNILFV